MLPVEAGGERLGVSVVVEQEQLLHLVWNRTSVIRR